METLEQIPSLNKVLKRVLCVLALSTSPLVEGAEVNNKAIVGPSENLRICTSEVNARVNRLINPFLGLSPEVQRAIDDLRYGLSLTHHRNQITARDIEEIGVDLRRILSTYPADKFIEKIAELKAKVKILALLNVPEVRSFLEELDLARSSCTDFELHGLNPAEMNRMTNMIHPAKQALPENLKPIIELVLLFRITPELLLDKKKVSMYTDLRSFKISVNARKYLTRSMKDVVSTLSHEAIHAIIALLSKIQYNSNIHDSVWAVIKSSPWIDQTGFYDWDGSIKDNNSRDGFTTPYAAISNYHFRYDKTEVLPEVAGVYGRKGVIDFKIDNCRFPKTRKEIDIMVDYGMLPETAKCSSSEVRISQQYNDKVRKYKNIISSPLAMASR